MIKYYVDERGLVHTTNPHKQECPEPKHRDILDEIIADFHKWLPESK